MQFRRASYISLVLIAVASFVTSILCVMNINGEVRLFKTKLEISFNNNVFTYDGKKIENDEINYEFIKGKLAYDDRFEITLNEEIKSAGQYERNSFSYKIISGGGSDVTNSYDISEIFELIVVNPRSICFRSGDNVFVYDGKPHKSESLSLYSGFLANGESYTFSGFREFTAVGTYENYFNVNFYNVETKLNTTFNYDISREFGVIMVVKGE